MRGEDIDSVVYGFSVTETERNGKTGGKQRQLFGFFWIDLLFFGSCTGGGWTGERRMWVRRAGVHREKERFGWMEDGKVQTEWQTCWSVAKASRERCHISRETKKERGSKGGKGEAMPAVERLGRASPPLSVWLGAAAPEEIKKCPGVVVLVLEEEEVDLDSEKDESEKVLFERPKNSSEKELWKPRKQQQAIFSFFKAVFVNGTIKPDQILETNNNIQ